MLLKINHEEKDVLNYQLITTDAQLKKVCQAASEANKIALDTEFVRVKTITHSLALFSYMMVINCH